MKLYLLMILRIFKLCQEETPNNTHICHPSLIPPIKGRRVPSPLVGEGLGENVRLGKAERTQQNMYRRVCFA